jgi:hypothetical protein
MADLLYLSLWFPDFRLTSLAPALVRVLRQVAASGGSPRVHAATVYPISWSESPVYQRVYREEEREESAPERAVAEACAALHEDFAFEFEARWDLWTPPESPCASPAKPPARPSMPATQPWDRAASVVRVVGFGPLFDDGAYEQNGEIRVDFGVDSPFLGEEAELDGGGCEYLKGNIQQLLEFTNLVQRNCGVSGRLLWSESGENLAEKLIARLQRVN